eukprot:TRINITY_DN3729_c0_g1_i1.p1 TRINITY_DN3729_c0_g1~~TRINITY_DN3729_c0_g1_i1.p1  ORF type:complete len:181 (+),score=37.69 TRINITY_DN3729_c0_g1_i1:52-594(+)
MDFATTDTNPLVDLSQDRSEDLSTSEEEDQHLSWSARLFSMNKPEKHSKANKQQAVVQAQKELLKFSRMTTHLANERTLLAWIRSSVALFGLGMLFVKVQGIEDLVVGNILMSMAVLTLGIGSVRYFALKRGLEDPEIRAFQRVGIKYYAVLCTGVFLGVLLERFYESLMSFVNDDDFGL